MTERLAKLQSAMRAAGIDVVAVVPGANMRYLAGLEIHSSERMAVAFFPAAGTPAMVLPALETPRAQAQARFPITFYPWDDADGAGWRAEPLCRRSGAGRAADRRRVHGDARAGAARDRGGRAGLRRRWTRRR